MMRSYLILNMCALFLLQYFLKLDWLELIVVAFALLAFISSAFKADYFPRLIGSIMMTVGIMIEWNKGTGLEGISEGILLILPLLSLITFAPLLSIPLRLGGYLKSVASMLANLMQHPRKLFAGITGTLFILTPILNLGSVRIINDFLEELKLPSAVTAKGYLVGFTTAVMWSPYFASVSLVLLYLHVPYKSYIVYGMSLSLLSLLIGNILFSFWIKRFPFERTSQSKNTLHRMDKIKLGKLILFVIALMSTCLTIEVFTHWSMIVIVCLVSIVIPILYAFISRDFTSMKPLLVDFRDRTVPMMNNEIMLFMSAGMLAFALKGTSALNSLSTFLTNIAQQSFILFAIAIIALVLVVTYFGIHQIAAVGTLAMQLNPADLGISNVGLAMLLLLTWAISTAFSPFSGLNLMVSKFTKISGFSVGLRSNGIHFSIFLIIGLLIISVIG